MLDPVKPKNPKSAKTFFESKMAFTTGPVELNSMIKENKKIVIVDVRAAKDYDEGHIPGAINLPKESWGGVRGLDKNKTNILYCYSQVCHLAARAAVEFSSLGYPVMEMEGGMDAWRKSNFDVESAHDVQLNQKKDKAPKKRSLPKKVEDPFGSLGDEPH